MSKAQVISVGRPMTVQISKTKAETALAEAFAAIEARLPGGDWLRKLRRAAIGAFTAEGLPHRRIEEWKYTDLRQLQRTAFPLASAPYAKLDAQAAKALVKRALPGADLSKAYALFVDGFGASENGLAAASKAVTPFLARLADHPLPWLEAQISEVGGHVGDGVAALNTALCSDGAVIDIADGLAVETPIALIFADGGGDSRTVATRNVLRVGKDAKAVVIECHLAPSAPRQVNTLTQLVIGDGAEVTHIKLVASRDGSIHLGRTVARIGANAHYRPFQMVVGDGLVRNDLAVSFAGQHSTFDLGAALLGHGHGHADTTLVVDHAVGHCTSRELVKCVLRDQTRAVFQGKVIVRPDAQKTDGKQMAQALMLSPDAEFDSKPELEIYADDVICGHGSTAAEIDPELVFYLRSRGIPLAQAQAMLVESFIGEAIDKAGPEDVQEALRALARQWLAGETLRTH
jgi:Fe-S cluster assembly protein SufD